MLIGAIAGTVCFIACWKLKTAMGYDDSLDAFGVHCIGGIVGALLTGVFADTAIDGGQAGSVVTQAIGVATTLVYSFVVSFVLLKIIDAVIGLRVNEEQEREGLVTERSYPRGDGVQQLLHPQVAAHGVRQLGEQGQLAQPRLERAVRRVELTGLRLHLRLQRQLPLHRLHRPRVLQPPPAEVGDRGQRGVEAARQLAELVLGLDRHAQEEVARFGAAEGAHDAGERLFDQEPHRQEEQQRRRGGEGDEEREHRRPQAGGELVRLGAQPGDAGERQEQGGETDRHEQLAADARAEQVRHLEVEEA
jgi:hypothetical protein